MKRIPWPRIFDEIRRLILLLLGAVLSAVGYAVFQVPYNIAAGGVSGVAILVNHFTGWPVSTFYLVANIPLFVLGYFYLGRWRFLWSTALVVVIFSFATQWLEINLPQYLASYPITDNILLSAIWAGLVGGIGGGLVYWAGSTLGGTAIVGRIIQIKTGLSLSQIYLFVDGTIVLAAGIIFGWETALYAMLTLLLSGIATDYVLEGPSRTRTATIITTNPQPIIDALMAELSRGVSHWEAVGGYTGERRTIIVCTIYRPQINDLKRILARLDPKAFVTIGITQEALGQGFGDLSLRE
jgi:uncharacterized membrane-anchored protein YitT (DUF2179 family)